MADNADLRLDVQKEVNRLAAECKVSGFDNAARFLADNRTAVVEIAIKARLEPKKRDLPSPFVYSMQ
jgi:hypothetical protein